MSPRLLGVDDDAALNLALCAHFEDRDWHATGVYDGAAALAATAEAAFGV
jgi:DNA-binding response OmpR family regulator